MLVEIKFIFARRRHFEGLHPFQNRVLSLAEAMRLQTIDRYRYQWGPVAKRAVAADSLIRLVIGESVPPLFLELALPPPVR